MFRRPGALLVALFLVMGLTACTAGGNDPNAARQLEQMGFTNPNPTVTGTMTVYQAEFGKCRVNLMKDGTGWQVRKLRSGNTTKNPGITFSEGASSKNVSAKLKRYNC